MLDNKSDQNTRNEYTKETIDPNSNVSPKYNNNNHQNPLNNEYSSMESSNSNDSDSKAIDNEEEDDLPFN